MVSEGSVIARGEWHPANSSRSVPASLQLAGGLVVAVGDAAAERHSAAEPEKMEFSPRVGSIPRRVVFPDGSLFETRDNDAIDAFVEKRRGRRSGFVHRLEEFHPRLIVFTGLVMLLAAGIYRYALPALVELAVLLTPPVVPDWMGAGTLSTLDRTTLSPSTLPEADRKRISDGFALLAAKAEGGADAYTLNFRDGGYIGPNAFALPDGSLILTDQLVELAKGDTDMILGVLGHEIGHVEKKHSLRQLYRAAGIAGLIMLIAGDVGSGVEDILTQGGGLLALSYSREAESEADRRSVELMRAAGRDSAAIARFFERLEEIHGDSGGNSMLSTHPGTPERRQAILDYDAQLRGATVEQNDGASTSGAAGGQQPAKP
ncbi:M48 family metallopeptidase [Rhizobium sp. LjRoot30]|uniref:M48 family metallopeptidase n=1 Tax=Rhizobium sp. LjRoot30 TaxID=3342320 RepID=UPI003ECF8C48